MDYTINDEEDRSSSKLDYNLVYKTQSCITQSQQKLLGCDQSMLIRIEFQKFLKSSHYILQDFKIST